MIRYKKTLYILVAALILCLCGCRQSLSSESAGAYPWDRTEEFLVGCTIDGDTVQFRYAMTYKNNSKYDVSISHIVCSFDPDELAGWFGNQPDALDENIQSGFVDNANGETIIQSGETQIITFVFEGVYLGGKLPDFLSKPDKVIWGERYVSSSQIS